MHWSTNTEPKVIGYFLCTVEEYGHRRVEVMYRDEYPKSNFYWMNAGISHNKKIVACMRIPKPYDNKNSNREV